MATLFLGERDGGALLVGMAVTAADVDALTNGETIMVELSATAQAVLETRASLLVLVPCEDEDVVAHAKRMTGSMIVDEDKMN